MKPQGKRDLTRTRTSTLKWRYGESKGTDKAVEEELRRRGFNSKQLAELEWDHSQKKWTKEAKKASVVRRAKKKAVRRRKQKRHKLRRAERRRQEKFARIARLKQGGVITGENLDPPACDGSCPIVNN